MAIAMMVNTQHLMYRSDILEELDIEVPETWEEVLAAAETIEAADVVDYPLGATMKSGWNLGQDFVNMYLGHGGKFFDAENRPLVNSPEGVAALETMKRITEYTDPEYLVSDSTYVQQQFQQGKIAMANLWSSRAGAMNDPGESDVVGLVEMAKAPAGPERTASTIWWDGVVIAKNITEAEAEAAFRVAMEGLDREMVEAHNDVAVWLVEGYEPGPIAEGAIATAEAGALPYPASTAMGMMHTALGNELPAFFTGEATAEEALEAVEQAYTTAAEEAGILE
jgi:ABC-type glycerol-3-phosphate transport system substrate-binding protein